MTPDERDRLTKVIGALGHALDVARLKASDKRLLRALLDEATALLQSGDRDGTAKAIAEFAARLNVPTHP